MSPRTEGELLAATIQLAELNRWAIHHDRPARTGHGWRTAIQGHAGFPDLVLARAGVVLFRELKGYDVRGRVGRMSAEQRDWAKQLDPFWLPVSMFDSEINTPDAIREMRLIAVFDVWTPDDWDLIVTTLTAKPARRTA